LTAPAFDAILGVSPQTSEVAMPKTVTAKAKRAAIVKAYGEYATPVGWIASLRRVRWLYVHCRQIEGWCPARRMFGGLQFPIL
jgi:hypothetical protein